MEKIYKKLAANVEEEAEDIRMTVKIDENLLARINAAARTVRYLKAQKIVITDNTPQWQEYVLDNDDEVQLGGYVDLVGGVMEVSADEVWWVAFKSDTGLYYHFRSNPIKISQIMEDFSHAK